MKLPHVWLFPSIEWHGTFFWTVSHDLMCVYFVLALLCAVTSFPTYSSSDRVFQVYKMLKEWLIIAELQWIAMAERDSEFRFLGSQYGILPSVPHWSPSVAKPWETINHLQNSWLAQEGRSITLTMLLQHLPLVAHRDGMRMITYQWQFCTALTSCALDSQP